MQRFYLSMSSVYTELAWKDLEPRQNVYPHKYVKIGTLHHIYMIEQGLILKFLYKDTYVSNKHMRVIKLSIADLQ